MLQNYKAPLHIFIAWLHTQTILTLVRQRVRHHVQNHRSSAYPTAQTALHCTLHWRNRPCGAARRNAKHAPTSARKVYKNTSARTVTVRLGTKWRVRMKNLLFKLNNAILFPSGTFERYHLVFWSVLNHQTSRVSRCRLLELPHSMPNILLNSPKSFIVLRIPLDLIKVTLRYPL